MKFHIGISYNKIIPLFVCSYMKETREHVYVNQEIRNFHFESHLRPIELKFMVYVDWTGWGKRSTTCNLSKILMHQIILQHIFYRQKWSRTFFCFFFLQTNSRVSLYITWFNSYDILLIIKSLEKNLRNYNRLGWSKNGSTDK